MKLYRFIIIAATLGFLSCQSETQSFEAGQPEDDSADFTLNFESVNGALDVSKIKYFRLRIYPKAPLSAESDTLFDSLKTDGCVGARTDVRIKDLKAGDGRFVYYEGFSDKECTERVAVGVRGNIDIQDKTALQVKAEETECEDDVTCMTQVHPDARCDCDKSTAADGKPVEICNAGESGYCAVSPPVYVPLFEVGRFTRFPTPSTELQAMASQTTCISDADCKSVHATATCNQDVGYCEVAGLFPLSASRPRAFHEAMLLPNGNILMSGGFTKVEDINTFVAGQPYFEEFNPFTGQFESPLVQKDYPGRPVAMQRSVLLDNDILVTAGGLGAARFKLEPEAEGLAFTMEVPFKDTWTCAGEGCSNVSDQVVSSYLAGGGSIVGTMDRPLMAHRTGAVSLAGELMVILTGGVVYDDVTKTLGGNPGYLHCRGEDFLLGNTPSCSLTDDDQLIATRFGHSDLCLLQDSSGTCDEYILFGGTTSESPTGELFSSDATPANKALSFSESTSLKDVRFPELAVVPVSGTGPDKIYSFGGTASVATQAVDAQEMFRIVPAAPSIAGYELSINLKSGVMTTQSMDLSRLSKPEDVYRLFHAVAVLAEPAGRIMVLGGLGSDLRPTNDVMFFEDPNTGTLEYISGANMTVSRFGHSATVLQNGVLAGAVLVMGGLTVDVANGTIQFANAPEIYIP